MVPHVAATNTVDALLLPGWMPRDLALHYLLNECVFPEAMTPTNAECIWRKYTDAVQGLGKRTVVMPPLLEMNDAERRHADAFLGVFHRQLKVPSIQDVIKIDPGHLVVRQFYVVVDRSDGYGEDVCSDDGWAKHCLPTTVPTPKQIRIFSGVNAANVEVPHAEFFFTHNPQAGFSIQEYLRHISVSKFADQDRMLLWAGYHRSYARMARAVPEAMVRSALMVLTTDGTLDTSPGAPDQGLRAIICGDTPPLFSDFLDDRLVMKVKLRKKRYELQIRANLVGINL